MPAREFGDGDPEAAVAALIGKLPGAFEDVTLEQFEEVAAAGETLVAEIRALSDDQTLLMDAWRARMEGRGPKVRVGDVATEEEEDLMAAMYRLLVPIERAYWALGEWKRRAGVPGSEDGPRQPAVTEGLDGELLIRGLRNEPWEAS